MDTQRWVLLGILAIVMVGILLYSVMLVRRASRLRRKLEENPSEAPAAVPGASTPGVSGGTVEPPRPAPRGPASALGRLEAFSTGSPGSPESPRLTAPEHPPFRAPEAPQRLAPEAVRPGTSETKRPTAPEGPRLAAPESLFPVVPEKPTPAPPEALRPRTSEGSSPRAVSPLDLEGPPPPAPKGSEAEEAALLLAGQQPKGLPSFSDIAAVSAAEAAAVRNAEVDADAIDALSLRSMIGFHSRKPIVKVEVAPPPSLEQLLAEELAEKQSAGGPSSLPAAATEARPDPTPPSPARLKPEALAGLAALGGTRAPAAGKTLPRAATEARGPVPAAPVQPVKPAVDVATLERQFMNNPGDPGLKRSLAERYLEVDRLDDAIPVLVELLESDVSTESDLFNLGIALSRRGYVEDAKACFQRLKSEHVGSPWAAKAAVQLLKLKLGS